MNENTTYIKLLKMPYFPDCTFAATRSNTSITIFGADEARPEEAEKVKSCFKNAALCERVEKSCVLET